MLTEGCKNDVDWSDYIQNQHHDFSFSDIITRLQPLWLTIHPFFHKISTPRMPWLVINMVSTHVYPGSNLSLSLSFSLS